MPKVRECEPKFACQPAQRSTVIVAWKPWTVPLARSSPGCSSVSAHGRDTNSSTIRSPHVRAPPLPRTAPLRWSPDLNVRTPQL